MGMDILKLPTTRKNRVYVRIDKDNLRMNISVDAAIFPLYCTKCGKAQSKLYEHLGSRYGQVGCAVCENCGEDIVVIDHDNIVESIYINNYPSNEIFFSDLYLLDWRYINEFNKSQLIEIFNKLTKYNRQYIDVDELRTIIEEIILVKTDGSMKFVTDERFSILPDDINRWIELLYRAGIKTEGKRIK